MKKILLTCLAFAAINSIPAHAINHAYRAQLERSGCTQVSDGHGCDIHKTKAENARAMDKKHPSTSYTSYGKDADVVMNADINNAADYLLAQGWKPNNGDWHKDGYLMRLVVENGYVVNAQVMH